MAGAVPAAIRVTPANSAQSAEVQSRRNGIVPPAELRAIRASSVLNAELRNLKHGIAPNAVPRESRANSALNAEHLSAVRKRGTKVTVNRYMLEKL